MTDISAFPTIHQVWKGGAPPLPGFTAKEAITAGMVVGMAGSGDGYGVVCMDQTAGERPFAVAMITAASGAPITLLGPGSIAEVAVADDTTGVDAGSWVETNDNPVKGTVNEFSPRADLGSTVIDASNDTTIDGSANIIGMAMNDGAGGGTFDLLVIPYLILYSDHAVVS